ncbi:MAG: hypothetical protein V3W31_02975 [Thermodesulfobacteriota bacterium]
MKNPENYDRGTSLIEILLVAGYLAIVIASSAYGARTHGWPGLAIGFVLGIAVPVAFVSLLVWLEKWLWVGVPYLPVCRNGTCRLNDYDIVPHHGDLTYVCPCGLRFRKKGRQFLEVADDGPERPYLIWRPFRGWFPEE